MNVVINSMRMKTKNNFIVSGALKFNIQFTSKKLLFKYLFKEKTI